ncbi:MAG: aminotransferase class IV [Bacteroidota bacterium]
MDKPFVVINDSFIAEDKAALSVNDLAIQRGYGIFDFFRTINGKFIFIDDHLDRFFHSASKMRLPVNMAKDEFKALLAELAEKNKMPDSGIRVTLTGGYSADGYAVANPNLVITQKPLLITQEDIPSGISLVSYQHQRQLPDVKTIDYIMAIWLKPYITQHHADDVLYHRGGIVTECPRSNIFIVTQDEQLITPANNILKGINRNKILQIVGENFTTKEKDISLDDVISAKEVFITSTTKLVLPVLKVDGHLIGTGKPGQITLQLRKQLQQLISE